MAGIVPWLYKKVGEGRDWLSLEAFQEKEITNTKDIKGA